MFSFFESKEKKYIKTHLRHLSRLAMADGEFHKKEKKFIKQIGEKNGLAKEEIKEIIQNPTDIDIELPTDDKERFDQIFDLVSLMMKDGMVNDAEMEFCEMLANRLGFRKVIVGVLVAKIQRGISGGLSREQIMEESSPFISY